MNQKPSRTMRTLAVAGFLALIALLVWLAVTLVAALPGTFASLASLAESLQQSRTQPELVVANSSSITNNGESFTVSWSKLKPAGVYTISYPCTEGVALEMRYPANNITPIPCDEVIKLGSGVTELELTARSERQRFIDVSYTIGFIPASQQTVAFETENTFTVVNVNIPQGLQPEEESETPDGAVAGETTDETVEEPVTQPTTSVTPREPEVIATEIFELPTSDPNGFVDLAVKYVGVGRLASNNRFIPGGVIDADTRGAFQFEVRNLGTKTSRNWTFDATLTSGNVYESQTQDGLLPNEYTIITIGFDQVGETGAQAFGASIDVPGDNNATNDSFQWAVNIVD